MSQALGVSACWCLLQPDYTAVNQLYLSGKTRSWAAGSLESLVESVVKTLEMEISHKVCVCGAGGGGS
jgi:hypothetical protein